MNLSSTIDFGFAVMFQRFFKYCLFALFITVIFILSYLRFEVAHQMETPLLTVFVTNYTENDIRKLERYQEIEFLISRIRFLDIKK